MKSKFKIKITSMDNAICIETRGTVSELLIGLRCLTKSLITNGDIPAEIVKKTLKMAIMEAEHEPTKHD